MDTQTRLMLIVDAGRTLALLRNDFEASGEEDLLALVLEASGALTQLHEALRP